MSATQTDPRQKLREIEAELSEARDENAVLRRERDKTRAEFANSPGNDPNSAVFKRAQKASEEFADSSKRIEDLTAVQVATLKMFGETPRGRRDQNGPRAGEGGGGDGWATAARELSIADGRLRVDMPARDLLAAGLKVNPGEGGFTSPARDVPGVTASGQDHRGLYGVFPRENVEQGDLALTEWVQTGSRSVEGEVEREPTATSEKAKLSTELTLETPALVQWAVVIEKVPAKLFDAVPALQDWLTNELKYQVELGVDAHCLVQIAAASPPVGETGATLIEKVRNAIAAMRALGANPTVLALDPTTAAALDVMKTGEEGMESYLFASRATGSSSPLFGCNVVEVPNLSKPLLIDPGLTGILYTAVGSVLVDPYSGMDSNEVRVRCEIDGLLHCRDISGVYEIDKP